MAFLRGKAIHITLFAQAVNITLERDIREYADFRNCHLSSWLLILKNDINK